MNRWHVRVPVHVENETSVGRREADFAAGGVVPADQGEQELLEHLAGLYVTVDGEPQPVAEQGHEHPDPKSADSADAKTEPTPAPGPRGRRASTTGAATSDDDKEGDI